VPRQHQAFPVVGLRARGDDQVGLAAVAGTVPLDADAGPVEVVTEEIGQREIARAAGGVEGDEPREQGPIVERGSGRSQVPGSVESFASRARTSRTPG
jgi:hypothetical protein